MKNNHNNTSVANPGSICGFYYQDKYLLGMITAITDSYCTITSETADILNLSIHRLVIISQQIYSHDNIVALLHEFKTAVSHSQSLLNAEEIWHKLQNHADALNIDELTTLVSDNFDDLTRFALFTMLRENPGYFRQKGSLFYIRTADEYISFLAIETEQKKEDEYYNDLHTWLQNYLKAQDNTSYDVDSDFLTDITLAKIEQDLAHIYHGKPSHRIKHLCNCLLPGQSLKELFLLIRKALGQVYELTPFIFAYSLLPHLFSKDICQSADIIPTYIPDGSRLDFAKEPCWTIDSDTSQDLDDAVSIKETQDGWLLGIHIADVTHFVKPGSDIDIQAHKRTSSIYLPDCDIHMLPEAISCNKASLIEGKLRPAISLLCNINKDYEIVSSDIVLTSIKVTQRLDYDTFENNNNTDNETHKLYHLLSNITAVNKAKRAMSISATSPESELSPARLIVAELMIIYNSHLAQYAKSKNIPFLYRFLDTQVRPHKEPENVMIPLTPPSVISTTPKKHQALGLNVYAQLSSPLRRYSDLVNQRQIVSALTNTPSIYSTEELQQMITHLNNTRQTIRLLSNQAEQFYQLTVLNKSYLNSKLTAIVWKKLKKRYILHLPELDYKVQTILPAHYLQGSKLIISITGIDFDNSMVKAIVLED
jgi:exoribonuclease-2